MQYRKSSITELNLYSSENAPEGMVCIEGFWYPVSIVQELYEILHINYKSILLYGPPGGGKTHLAIKLVPVLLAIIRGKEVKNYYSNLGDYVSNVSDFKYYPVLRDNTLYYIKSQQVKLNEASIGEDFVVNNIIDEVSRISNDAQNQLLPLTEDNESRAFILSHMGEEVRIKKENQILLLMNPDGGGTTTVNQALLDRVAIVEIPAPTEEYLNLIFSGSPANRNSGQWDLNNLKPIKNREIGRYQTELIIENLMPFSLSIRQYKEIFWFLKHSPYPQSRLSSFLLRRIKLGLISNDDFASVDIERSFVPSLFDSLHSMLID